MGGKKVTLIFVGPSLSNNSIAMHFPDEHTVFAVYIVSYQRVPFKGLGDSYFPDWINALQVVSQIYFDVLAPRQGKMGTKVDAGQNYAYLKEMYGAIYAWVRAGK